MAKRSSDTVFRKYRLFLISNRLHWRGSYEKKGNALHYLEELGSHCLGCVLAVEWVDGRAEVVQGWVMMKGEIREANKFELALLGMMPAEYYNVGGR